MGNVYAEIAQTYVRRKQLWHVAAMGGCVVVMAFRYSPVPAFATSIPLTLLMVGSIIVMHLKEQMAHPNARLVPNYRVPHLIVAGGVSFILMIFMTALWVLQKEELVFPDAFAVMAGLFVLSAWMQMRFSMLLFLLYLPVLVALFVPPARDWIMAIAAGDKPELATWIFAVSLLGIIALAVRLATLREEMPEYRTGFLLNTWALGPREERQQWRAWQASGPDWLVSLLSGAFRIKFLSRPIAPGMWPRARLWRLGRSSISPLAYGLLIGAVKLMVLFNFPGFFSEGMFAYYMLTLIAVTTLYTCMTWLRRWPRLGHESLLPVERRRFIRELGFSFALDLVGAWLWPALVVGLVMAIAMPNALLSPALWVVLPFTVLYSLWHFALTAWLSVYRSVPLLFAGMVATWPIYSLPMMLPIVRGHGAAGYATVAAGLVAISLGMIAFAYRKWCNLDLA